MALRYTENSAFDHHFYTQVYEKEYLVHWREIKAFLFTSAPRSMRESFHPYLDTQVYEAELSFLPRHPGLCGRTFTFTSTPRCMKENVHLFTSAPRCMRQNLNLYLDSQEYDLVERLIWLQSCVLEREGTSFYLDTLMHSRECNQSNSHSAVTG